MLEKIGYNEYYLKRASLCELSYSLQANTFCESERSNWIHLEIKKKQER